jgi:hypothetical protein
MLSYFNILETEERLVAKDWEDGGKKMIITTKGQKERHF